MSDSKTSQANEIRVADSQSEDGSLEESGTGPAERLSRSDGLRDDDEVGRSMEDAPTSEPETSERMPGLPQAHRGPF